ncbi:hypothetical protein, partial [uncultured Alistipes sp.]|uniref:hypothetical protein n=1 Tax=uncultured Alistipes sp. TaxID=538949 RepID=UPI002804A4A8
RRPDADIGIGRVAFAAFRHRKAVKKEKVFRKKTENRKRCSRELLLLLFATEKQLKKEVARGR